MIVHLTHEEAMKKLLKINNLYTVFLIPPKKWSKPQKSDILVYDYESLEPLTPYIEKYSHTSLAVRGESINFYCLILSMFKLDFWTNSAFKAYINKYISLVSPKIIITFIDNDLRFYEISNNFPDVKTIFVQNGRRGILEDIFATIEYDEKYHVDYMLVFNKLVGELYSKYISGEVIIIGSIKNNSVLLSENYEKDTVVFISSLSTHSNSDKPLLTKPDGYKTDRETIHAIDKLVVEFLDDWCAQNQKTLKILGRSFGLESDEYFFYLNCLNKCKWDYIPRQEIYNSYHQLNMAEIVVFIDSTLGYEALSRGKKTAGFICQTNFLNLQSERFGWPAVKGETGPFWTHVSDITIFSKIMDFLNNIDNIGWDSVRKEHASDLMYFDQGNLGLQILLVNLL